MFLILLGGPGSGKGTQARRMSHDLGLDHLSTGDILRKAIVDQTDLGKMARSFMDAGQLVPDNIILGMIKEELTNRQRGVIFDGFPRTPAQAEGLEAILKELGKSVTKVINLAVDDAIIIDRLTARRICKANGHEYNLITKPPKMDDICDLCGSELYRRSDDNPEVIGNRLKVYHEQAKPVEDYYRIRGLLIEIDGSMHFDEVFAAIIEAVTVVR